MPTSNPPKKPYHNYVKYSSLAIQAGILTFGLAYGGVRLDEFLGWHMPVFTVSLSLLGVVAAMFILLKDVIKPKK